MATKTRKALKITSIVLLSIIILELILWIIPRPDNYKGKNVMISEGEMPLLIAHGGGNKEFPDNTLEAFYNAYSVDNRVMLETDVSITKDGVVILCHDLTLDRTTNVTGLISDWNYTDLIDQKVDFGYLNPTKNGYLDGDLKHYTDYNGVVKFPKDVEYPEGVEPRDEYVFLATTLEDLLVTFPDNYINVEIKQSGDLGKKAFLAVIDLLEEYDAFDRVVLASFHPEIYEMFVEYKKEDKVPENFMFSPCEPSVVKYVVLRMLNLDFFYNEKIAAFQLPMAQSGIKLATRFITKNANRHNIAVHYWTINDEDDMRKLIEIGADGIMTDMPHRLKEVYDSYKNG